MKVQPDYNGEYMTLGDIIIDEKKVPPEFFIDEKDIQKWEYLK